MTNGRHCWTCRLPLPIVCLAMVWGTVPRPAVAQQPPRRGTPSAAASRELREGHESETETIAKCVRDLRSPEVEVRRRAVLILGKYQRSPAAIASVLRCLRDDDAQVRRSALVSISEWNSVPTAARLAVVDRLLDPDVHVRRLASSMLTEIVGLRLVTRLTASGRTGTAAAAPLRRPPVDMQTLNRALDDKDPFVVKNVLSAARYLPAGLEQARLDACLARPEEDIRLLALRACRQRAAGNGICPDALLARVRDPSARVRAELARVLAGFGEASVAPLRLLAQDDDPTVRAQAVQYLASRRVDGGFELLSGCLRDADVPVAAREGLLPYLALYAARAQPILQELARDGDPGLRATAVRIMASGRDQSTPVDDLLDLLRDPRESIRSAASSGLLRHAARLEPPAVAALAVSDYADVRLLAVRLCHRVPAEDLADMLMELCLDDDNKVRAAAITQIGLRRVPDWRLILTQSLDDPDPVVQLAGAEALLMRPDIDALKRVTAFLDTCENPATVNRLRLRLNQAQRRLQRPPAPSRRTPLVPRR